MMNAPKSTLLGRARNLFQFSTAAWVTVVAAIASITFVIVAWTIYRTDPERVAWNDYMQWSQVLRLVSTIGVICFLTYWTVRLWNEDLPASERDLEQEWHAGVTALTRRGSDIRHLPIYLVLGCTDSATQERIVKLSGCRLVIEPTPSNGSAIKWFVAEDRILLFGGSVGCFGTTQSRMSIHQQQTKEIDIELERRARWNVESELQRKQEFALESAAKTEIEFQPIAESGRRTVEKLGGSPTFETRPAVRVEVAKVQTDSGDQLSEDVIHRIEKAERLVRLYDDVYRPDIYPTSVESQIEIGLNEQILSSTEQVRLQERLKDLCRRFRTVRGEVAPINGVVAWINTPQLIDCDRMVYQCGMSIRRDLELIQSSLGVQVPISFMLDRMYQLEGFGELIRRRGPDRANQEMLGNGFPINCLPRSNVLERASHSCVRSILVAIHAVMRSNRGVQQPGNHKLFQLLIACRGRLHRVLGTLLVSATGCDLLPETSQSPMLYSGAFFGSSGEQPLEQGFVRAIFDRMHGQQELLNWTSARKQQIRRYHRTLWLLQGIVMALAALLVGQLLFESIR